MDPRREPFQAKQLEVIPKSKESFEKMIKRFTRKVRDEGILQLFNMRSRYEKPSDKRRRKLMQSKFNAFVAKDKESEIK